MRKLLFHRETRVLLGVHIIGEKASVLTYGGTIDYFVDNVFNYPSLSAQIASDTGGRAGASMGADAMRSRAACGRTVWNCD